MPTMKTDEERGPSGAWAYHARDDLDLSPESVVHDLGKYNAATIRKAESDSRKNMSRPLWRALVPYYQKAARAKGLTLPEPPGFGVESGSTPTDQQALVEAIDRQTAAIRDLITEIAKMWLRQDIRSQRRADEVMDKVAAIAVRVGVTPPEPGDSPAETPASTRTADAGPDRPPAKHPRTRPAKKTFGGARPGYVDEPDPVMETRAL